MSGKYKIDQDVSHPLLITSRQNNRILLQFRKSGAGPTDQPHTISMTPRSAMELLALLEQVRVYYGLAKLELKHPPEDLPSDRH